MRKLKSKWRIFKKKTKSFQLGLMHQSLNEDFAHQLRAYIIKKIFTDKMPPFHFLSEVAECASGSFKFKMMTNKEMISGKNLCPNYTKKESTYYNWIQTLNFWLIKGMLLHILILDTFREILFLLKSFQILQKYIRM